MRFTGTFEYATESRARRAIKVARLQADPDENVLDEDSVKLDGNKIVIDHENISPGSKWAESEGFVTTIARFAHDGYVDIVYAYDENPDDFIRVYPGGDDDDLKFSELPAQPKK